MMIESIELADAVVAHLNPPPGPEEPPTGQLPPLPPRPADGDSAEVWLDYVVALGGDRDMFGQFGAEELTALANRFGG